MNIQEIFSLPSFDDIKKELTKRPWTAPETETIAKQISVADHNVMSNSQRPDRIKTTDAGTVAVPVCRIPIPLQVLIVEQAIAFLFGTPVKLAFSAITDNELLIEKMIRRIWDSNKLDYVNREIARKLFSETEVAEIWFPVEDPEYWLNIADQAKFKLRCQVVSPLSGNSLYPYFDEFGDMVAFSRNYKYNSVEFFETYTAENFYRWQNNNGSWIAEPPVKNMINKIPVVYYRQEQTEWANVQKLIERLETVVSNHGDTNDYNGSPIIKVTGSIRGFASKGESGKIIEMDQGASADYLTWNQAPESIKLEIENLLKFIYLGSFTLDFDKIFDSSQETGVAMKLKLILAHLKVQNKTEIFGKAIDRRLSILKAFTGVINTSVETESKTINITNSITPYVPEDAKAFVELLLTANGGKPILSQQSAVSMNGMVTDSKSELEQIKKEESESLGSTFNI